MLSTVVGTLIGFFSLLTVVGILIGLFTVYSAGHALLNKRDPRAALGWITACFFLLPPTGAVLYWLFGVNRVHSRAQRWHQRGDWAMPPQTSQFCHVPQTELPSALKDDVGTILKVSDRITPRPVLGGNRIAMLHSGEQAYPAMLAAIESARRYVYLSTYIFDTDPTGQRFIDALRRASTRGIDVRVLVDGLGELYSLPPVSRFLRKTGVSVALFLPMSRGIHINLRNHRKLLIIDCTTGFTGGMNIGDRHLAMDKANPRRVVDFHVRVDGPVVLQMEEVFLNDWGFATGDSPPASSQPTMAGDTYCRGISSGPNQDFETLRWVIIGAISSAKSQVQIMTPYFIPDRVMISTLTAAAFRGISIDIILPQRNNLPFVAWATQALLWELLVPGIRIYYQPPPFVHSKYLLVDSAYVLLGSANLDPRSLRLNFEFNLEIYDHAIAAELQSHFEAVRSQSRQITLAEVDDRPLFVKLRDATTKLFSPYL
jgi:cardiolipin synthase